MSRSSQIEEFCSISDSVADDGIPLQSPCNQNLILQQQMQEAAQQQQKNNADVAALQQQLEKDKDGSAPLNDEEKSQVENQLKAGQKLGKQLNKQYQQAKTAIENLNASEALRNAPSGAPKMNR